MSPSLEHLVVSDIPNLVELPSSFQNLHQLWRLEIRNCVNLETLPTDINLLSLGKLNLNRCSRLRTFPDISINIEELNLSETGIEEVPPWIEKFSELRVLEMKGCINLETLPTGINLQSLRTLDLSGCSKLTTFPDISTNIRELYLSGTGIEELPCWIEKFSRLEFLEMNGCNKLNSISLNVFKLGHLNHVDFSDCKAMTGASWSFSRGGYNTYTNFNNCFNLVQEAIFEQNTYFGCTLCLSGEEVPSYFTHRTTATSSSFLTIPLLPSSLSQPSLRFRACLVLNSDNDNAYRYVFFLFKCRFWNSFDSFGPAQFFKKSKEFHTMQTSAKGSHLLILECSIQAEMNYTHVDLQLDCPYCEDKVKEWGIRLCSSADKRLSYPNTLPHVFQTDEVNTLNEAGEGEESGGEDEVTEPSSKRMRIS